MGMLEAQDVLAECDDVEFVYLEPESGFTHKENFLSRLIYHDFTDKLIKSINPGLKPIKLNKEYDLFLLICPWWRDVWYANAIQDWKDQCKTSVCWINELWIKSLTDITHWLPILEKFDHIIVGLDGTGEALEKVIGRQCHEITGGVDTLRFSPYPNLNERVIDIYSIGRRLENIHQSLCKLASHKNLFYIFDTLQSAVSQTADHQTHRNMYANMAKRSRFFTVSPAKVNFSEKAGSQDSIAFRYFEGASAGTVMIGQAPDCHSFQTQFDWPDAVIEIHPDGSDVDEVLTRLIKNPKRILDISRRNSTEALLRHDWVYRWEEILTIAGLATNSKLHERKNKLKTIAEMPF